MEIIKIIGIGLISLIIIVILKQYKPEFALYVSILARDIYTNYSNAKDVWNNRFVK